MDNVERLMEFGLTRHEANLYILLTLEGSLNGYEAAKQSGISRSNAYNALAGLVDKGAAYIQEEDTVRYTPVAIEEFCSNKHPASGTEEDRADRGTSGQTQERRRISDDQRRRTYLR